MIYILGLNLYSSLKGKIFPKGESGNKFAKFINWSERNFMSGNKVLWCFSFFLSFYLTNKFPVC